MRILKLVWLQHARDLLPSKVRAASKSCGARVRLEGRSLVFGFSGISQPFGVSPLNLNPKHLIPSSNTLNPTR